MAHRPALRSGLALATLLLTACSTSTGSGSDTTVVVPTPTTTAAATTTAPSPTTAAPTTTSPAPTTSEAPATTVSPTTTAATTTVAPTTTVPGLVLTDLVLRADAIGPLTFGDVAGDVVAALADVLGLPATDEIRAYPTDEGGYWSNDADESGFSAPHGRDVCYANGLCVYFGGSVPDALTFVGWLQNDAPGALATRIGITVGSRGSDHVGEMTVDEGGCFTTGGGDAEGVGLFLISEGTPFLEFVGDEFVLNTPDLADVTVLQLSAGEQPFFLFDDC